MLRHAARFERMDAVDRTVAEKRQVIPRFAEPPTVKFRRGGDLQAVVADIERHPAVNLSAAVGSGKSTEVPTLLAKATGKLIIHTIPFGVAAQDLAEYLGKKGVPNLVYVDDVESDWPTRGVIITTNAVLVARYAFDKLSQVKGAVLYMDEVHESDAWTAVVRQLAVSLKVFSGVVYATATDGPAVSDKNDLPGNRVLFEYQFVKSSEWSAYDEGRPWSASKILQNTLICIDNASARDRLANEYRDCGFTVRICTSATKYAEFQEVKKLLSDRAQAVVIVLVDYAYRSSFTIPGIGRIIDSGEVAVNGVVDGHPKVSYRQAYLFETTQFLGRGGRLPGEDVMLCKPKRNPIMAMCDVEEVEACAANLIFRIMGFRPPLMFARYDFYDGSVPIDIPLAMCSDSPLALCPPESRVPWILDGQKHWQQPSEPPFEYDARVKRTVRNGKTVSCHTVPEFERKASPPPPVPRIHSRHVFDDDDLDKFSEISSHVSEPTVITMDTADENDNLGYFENKDNIEMRKPKRVAKHVQLRREAEAAERAEAAKAVAVASAASELDKYQAEAASPVQVSATSGPVDLPADMSKVVKRDLNRSVSRVMPGMSHREDEYRNVHRSLTQDAVGGVAVDGSIFPPEIVGRYVYYHGMEKAPYDSEFFLMGLKSVMSFCDGSSKVHTRGLPESERLYAMSKLINAYNHDLAVVAATNRLLKELSARPQDDWIHLVDRDKVGEVLEKMNDQRQLAVSAALGYTKVMPMFADYAVDPIPDATELENRIMLELVKRFDDAAIKKDPDKVASYLIGLNDRKVKLTNSASVARRARYF